MDYIIFQNTLDFNTGGYVPKEIDRQIVDIVEGILQERSLPFVIYHKPDDVPFDLIPIEFDAKVKAIVGYGGRRTFPFISDPTESIRGAVGINEGKLIYSPRGIPLHWMRDSYTYGMQSPQENNFYTNTSFQVIVQEFLDKGYPLFFSPDMIDYQIEDKFTIERQLKNLDEITR